MGPRSTELRVGLFVMVALIIGGAIAFAIGDRRNVFDTKTQFRAEFEQVDGLRAGAPVRIAGLDVGTVTRVEFTPEGRVLVHMSVIDSSRHLVRRGVQRTENGRPVLENGHPVIEHASLATIGAKGMLGDKLVEVSVGLGEPLGEGELINTRPAVSMGQLMERGALLANKAESIVNNVDRLLAPLAEEEFTTDIRETTHNLAALSRMMAAEDGTVEHVLTDPQFQNRIDTTLANMQQMTAEMAATARSVRAITEEVRRGDGTAHELIYGQEGERLVRNLADVSGEIATVMHEVNTGDGLVHDVVYENNAAELMENATAMSADLRSITSDIRQGRGTIGGLLVDPSIYEDVKRLVGDLQRNDILRALVRYSIRRDDAEGTTEAVEMPERE